MNYFGSIFVMVVCIAMSAYFSATETAFSSLNKTRHRRHRTQFGDESAKGRSISLAPQSRPCLPRQRRRGAKSVGPTERILTLDRSDRPIRFLPQPQRFERLLAGETKPCHPANTSARTATEGNRTGTSYCSASSTMRLAPGEKERSRSEVLTPLRTRGIYAPGKAIAY